MTERYLFRSKTGYYIFRRGVPERLRETIGKREIKKALGKDRVLALARYAEIEQETDRLFSEATKRPADVRARVIAQLRKAGLTPSEVLEFQRGRAWEDDDIDLKLDIHHDELVEEYEHAEARGKDPRVRLDVIHAIGSRKLPKVVHTLASALDFYRNQKTTGQTTKDWQFTNRIERLKTDFRAAIGKRAVDVQPIKDLTRDDARACRDHLGQRMKPNSSNATLKRQSLRSITLIGNTTSTFETLSRAWKSRAQGKAATRGAL